MNAIYSPDILTIQLDDIQAASNLYGQNDIVRLEVHRFYNPTLEVTFLRLI